MRPTGGGATASLFSKIPGRPTPGTRLRFWVLLLVGLGVYGWASHGVGFNLVKVLTGVPEMGNLVMRMLPTEAVGGEFSFSATALRNQIGYVRLTWGPLAETLRIAILSALFGAMLSVPVSLLAARNLARFQWVYWTVRTAMNLLRTIPDLVLAAVFAGAFGIGVLPGILAMTVFSFTIIAKLLSESIESIDLGPVEAMRACGANRLQLIAYGVVPQVLPQFVAYVLYVFEINVRASLILGLVGAGGIGTELMTMLSFFEYQAVFVIIVVMLAVVVAVDALSTRLRAKLV